jgi:phenylalanine-4-hydroxylase
MKDDVKEYASKMKRPFAVKYNPLTQSIEVLDTRDKVIRFASSIQSDLQRLISAIDKVA